MSNKKNDLSRYEELKADWQQYSKQNYEDDDEAIALAEIDTLIDDANCQKCLQNIINNINNYINSNKISLQNFARKANISRQSLENLLKGKSKTISLRTLLNVSHVTRYSLNRLIK